MRLLKKYWWVWTIGLLGMAIPVWLVWIKRGEADSFSTCMYYTFEIVGGLGTLYAVLTALFINDMIESSHGPKIMIDLLPSSLGSETRDQGGDLHVDRYYHDIVVSNQGDRPASECELYIESIKLGDQVLKEEEKINWQGNQEQVHIHAGGHKKANFFEIKLEPNYVRNDVNPNPPVNNPRGQFFLNGESIPNEWYNQDLIVNLVLYSISIAEPVRKTIGIRYSGQWSADINAMRQNVRVESNNNNN